MGGSLYEQLDFQIHEVTRSDVGFTMEASEIPLVVDDEEYLNGRVSYNLLIKYFEGLIRVTSEALHGNLNPSIVRLLFGDSPPHLGVNFHTSLTSDVLTPPIFFRTDEASPGKILEIQCPGSQWGDYQVLIDILSKKLNPANLKYSLAESFAQQLRETIGSEPIVHHLLDNASIPHTMQYFIHRTRHAIKYYSLDKGVHPLDCNFIRSHSVYGLVAENYFQHRLKLSRDRKLKFDLPPYIPFDEKVSLTLPFLQETAQCFDEQVKKLFAFSTPIIDDQIQLEDGNFLSLQQFSSESRSNRSFYMKYGGSDVTLNWGSRGVYRLSNDNQDKCFKRLQEALTDFRERGRCWILQKEEKCYRDVEWNKRDGTQCSKNLPTGFRRFFGPGGLLGAMALHRNHYKVHGNQDTVMSICSGFTS